MARRARSGRTGIPLVGRDRLVLTVTVRGRNCALALSGALDHDSVIAFESQFDQLVAGDVTSVELDVDGLRSLDAAGVRSLNRLGQLLADRGTEVLIGGTTSAEGADATEAGAAGRRIRPPRRIP